ncbi:MAG: DUF3109 family protein [Anaerolineales bacterium]|nr:DUF3109 family protein [Anaerolineales bacterium]
MLPATEPDLIVNGVRVDADLLAARPVRRCSLAECQSYCCTGGVYVSVEHAADVLAHQHLIQPHLPEARRDPALWFDGTAEPDDDHPAGGLVTGTAVLPDATHPVGESCVFLRPDRLCALQATGLAEGLHPWRFKPFYCALHPLVYIEKRIVLSEESEMYLEGGSCNRPAPGQAVPLYELFDAELILALGEAGYAELKSLARARRVD